MRRAFFAMILVATLAVTLLPAHATLATTVPPPAAGMQHVSPQEGGDASDDGDRDIVPIVVWMFSGVAVSAVVLSILYLLKRRVGAFPKNPSWVAPITIMPSSELPGDVDPHEGLDDAHHAAAH